MPWKYLPIGKAFKRLNLNLILVAILVVRSTLQKYLYWFCNHWKLRNSIGEVLLWKLFSDLCNFYYAMRNLFWCKKDFKNKVNEIDLCHKLLDIKVIMAVELFYVIFMMNLTEIYSDVKRIKFYPNVIELQQ